MNRYYRRIRYLMGSPIEVTAYGEKEVCSKGIESAFSEIARVERLLSVYQPESELSRVNHFSKKGFITLDSEALQLLSQSIQYAEKSGGAFDPTSGPLIRLWGFGPGREKGVPPQEEEILSFLRHVGFQHLKIHFQSAQLQLLQEGMELNLGGIGKGYAIDRAVQTLKAFGIANGMVSCGSTLYGWGSPPGEPGWRIDIQHPRSKGERIGTVLLRNQALSTSGDYEKCFFFKGQRFGHLIDPRSGYPARGIASVSVIAPTALEADALSTAAFVLGAAPGILLLEHFPNVEGWIIQEDLQDPLSFHPTRGWEKYRFRYSEGRRRFVALSFLFLLGLFLPTTAGATVVYLTEEEALRRMMPEANRFDKEEIHLSPDQLSRAQELTGTRFREKDYRFQIGRKEDETIGYAILLDVIGKERPITFLIGIEPSGEIKGVEVLIYRESEGSEVRHSRFMRQFLKKKKEDPLRLGRDIQPISGATLSSRAATYAVRKALSIFEAVYK